MTLVFKPSTTHLYPKPEEDGIRYATHHGQSSLGGSAVRRPDYGPTLELVPRSSRQSRRGRTGGRAHEDDVDPIPRNLADPYRETRMGWRSISSMSFNDFMRLEVGTLVIAKVSIESLLQGHGQAFYGPQYRPIGYRGRRHKVSLLPGAQDLVDDGYELVTNRRGNRSNKCQVARPSIGETGSKQCTGKWRPCVIIATRENYHLIVPLTTFSGYGLKFADEIARSVAFALKGFGKAHSWIDYQHGRRVDITNPVLDIPQSAYNIHGKPCQRYMLAVTDHAKYEGTVKVSTAVAPLEVVAMILKVVLDRMVQSHRDRDTLVHAREHLSHPIKA